MEVIHRENQNKPYKRKEKPGVKETLGKMP